MLLGMQCSRNRKKSLLVALFWTIGSVRYMGGGPRTFPGGVTKWQWKRMQEKKKQERDKVWLAKERSLYERRRRAQVMALMPVRPWEKIHPEAPSLPKIDKDPKIQEMARRFQTDKGVDLWKKEDGPETCQSLVELDQDGEAPKPPVLKGFRPLSLSVSQRISDMSCSQQSAAAAAAQQARFRRSFVRQDQRDPPETPEVFQHSRFMLASYLRKQGHMGLGFSEAAIKAPVTSSSSSGDTEERTDYQSWLSALANDRARLAERQQSCKKKESSLEQPPADAAANTNNRSV